MWSMKLEQLSSLMVDYKNFWTQSLSLTKTGGEGLDAGHALLGREQHAERHRPLP
jgi:hypothetical protein